MNRENEIRKQLKNIEGKRLLEKTKLEYSHAIIEGLNNNPNILSKVLESLNITEKELWELLSGEKNSNVVLYDQALETIIKINIKNKINK